MAERKTIQNSASVKDFIAAVENDTRRQDAQVLVKMMRKISGKQAKMWGPSIIGFGVHNYTLASGKEESICQIGFSPRKSSFSFYLPSFEGKDELLESLGKYRRSKACLYVNKLADVDMEILESLVRKSWEAAEVLC